MKESTFILPYIAHCVNEDLVKSEFPDPLKLSNIVPVRKKEDATDKTNYSPNSVSSLLSKVLGDVRTALRILEQLFE